MGNSVIRHVDSGIRKRFNEEFRIARKSSTQTKVSRNTPFFQPSNRFFERLEDSVVVGVEFRRFNVIQNSVLPVFFSVLKVPLINIRNNTDIYLIRKMLKKTKFLPPVLETTLPSGS